MRKKLLDWSLKSRKRFRTFWSAISSLVFTLFMFIVGVVGLKTLPAISVNILLEFILHALLFLAMFALCYFGIFEAVYFVKERKRKEREKEELRKILEKKDIFPKPDTEGWLD